MTDEGLMNLVPRRPSAGDSSETSLSGQKTQHLLIQAACLLQCYDSESTFGSSIGSGVTAVSSSCVMPTETYLQDVQKPLAFRLRPLGEFDGERVDTLRAQRWHSVRAHGFIVELASVYEVLRCAIARVQSCQEWQCSLDSMPMLCTTQTEA